MRTVIIQPNFLPWQGYFDLIDEADNLVFLDNVQYTKNDWRNRNKIKTSLGPAWITVPVHFRLSERTTINDVEIMHCLPWKRKILRTLECCYASAPYFTDYFPQLCSIIKNSTGGIADLDIEIIKVVNSYLGINPEIFLASKMNIESTDRMGRLMEIFEKVETTKYLTGPSAFSYLNIESFKRRNIRLFRFEYSYEPYTQLFGDFIPSLSIIDLLFNCGPTSRSFFKSKTAPVLI